MGLHGVQGAMGQWVLEGAHGEGRGGPRSSLRAGQPATVRLGGTRPRRDAGAAAGTGTGQKGEGHGPAPPQHSHVGTDHAAAPVVVHGARRRVRGVRMSGQ